MNVLKRIVIPKIEYTIRYILSELEELEREDTFRLKRVKQNKMKKAKRDGAGERVEIDDQETDKEVEQIQSIVEEREDVQEEVINSTKLVVEVTSEKLEEDDKESITVVDESKSVQPKEAAEMGDLIVIKPTDDRLKADVLVSETELKEVSDIVKAKELTDNLKESDKEVFIDIPEELIKELSSEFISEASGEQDSKDEINAELETGEWFETANRSVDTKPSEYSKMDTFEDVIGEKRICDDTDSIPDIDKRATASLYRDIDTNFYKPTIDDIFSKHDIAMQDSSSHSLVDLESIDFSIDSKGKVVFCKRDSEESSPALSYREVDDTKQRVTYNEAGILIPKSSSPNLRWQTDNARNKVADNVDQNVESKEPTVSGNNKTKNKIHPTVNHNNESSKITTSDEKPINVNESKSMLEVSQDLFEKTLKFDIIDENFEHIDEDLTENNEENKNSGIQIQNTPDNQETLKPIMPARSRRDLHKIKDKHNIGKDTGITRLGQELPLTLNPIAEENEVELTDILDPDLIVDQSISFVATDKTGVTNTLNEVNDEAVNENTTDGTAIINNKKLKKENDTDTLENNVTNSKGTKDSEKDENISDEETKQRFNNKISEGIEKLNNKSDEDKSQNKQLSIKNSDEIKEDEEGSASDLKEHPEESEKEDENMKEINNESFNEGSPSTDEPERHNDHSKQD